MSYSINAEERKTNLGKKSINVSSKTKINISNSNYFYHPIQCRCHCHRFHATKSNNSNYFDSQPNSNISNIQNKYNRLSYNNINPLRNKSMNNLLTSFETKNRHTTYYNYHSMQCLNNKEKENSKNDNNKNRNKANNLNKKLNIIKTENDNLIKASVIYKNKMSPLYSLNITKKELSSYYHDVTPNKLYYILKK